MRLLSFSSQPFSLPALSFAGVIMIARPPFLFGEQTPSAGDVGGLMRWIAVASSIVSSFFSALAYG